MLTLNPIHAEVERDLEARLGNLMATHKQASQGLLARLYLPISPCISLQEKRIYAPMSNMGDLTYDADAVYINIPDAAVSSRTLTLILTLNLNPDPTT